MKSLKTMIGKSQGKRKNKLKEAALDLLGIPKRKRITFVARGIGQRKRSVSFLSPSLKVLRARARLKREIVKEILSRIYKEDYLSEITDGDGNIDTDIQDYWDEHGKNEVRKAARLAIELWEKRR